jgi:hypothetical protein
MRIDGGAAAALDLRDLPAVVDVIMSEDDRVDAGDRTATVIETALQLVSDGRRTGAGVPQDGPVALEGVQVVHTFQKFVRELQSVHPCRQHGNGGGKLYRQHPGTATTGTGDPDSRNH